jgi:hypothetical protein
VLITTAQTQEDAQAKLEFFLDGAMTTVKQLQYLQVHDTSPTDRFLIAWQVITPARYPGCADYASSVWSRGRASLALARQRRVLRSRS